MENTSRLYDTLFQALSQSGKWKDVRHKVVFCGCIGTVLPEERLNEKPHRFICQPVRFGFGG